LTVHATRDARTVRDWWRELQPSPADGRRGDPGALARLRRAASPIEALQEPRTVALLRRLGRPERLADRVALCAMVLAHVRDDEPGVAMARRLGPEDVDDPNSRGRLSALRFKRLLAAQTADEMLVQFRRVVALADGRADVAELADALLDWSDDRRRRWIFAYHDVAAPAAPLPSPETPTAGAVP
jgi:CRISPR system Cascade subunit CasB